MDTQEFNAMIKDLAKLLIIGIVVQVVTVWYTSSNAPYFSMMFGILLLSRAIGTVIHHFVMSYVDYSVSSSPFESDSEKKVIDEVDVIEA